LTVYSLRAEYGAFAGNTFINLFSRRTAADHMLIGGNAHGRSNHRDIA
jgi:hypothetical protein